LDVKIPMLFLQGTRDALADTQILQALVEQLGTQVTLGYVAHRASGQATARYGSPHSRQQA
jgi:hypothetical protein